MTALPIEGYAREYTDAAQLLADIAARKRRLAGLRLVVPDPAAPPPPPPPPPAPLALDEVIAQYRLSVDTFDPVVDLTQIARQRPPKFRWAVTARIVSAATGVSRISIESARRDKTSVYARQIACWLMRVCTPLSLPQIGRLVGDRDHTTVLHACLRVEEKMAKCAEYRREVQALRDMVTEELA